MSTQENLQAAFAGESQANRKYTAFAKKAEAEGKKQVARVFRAAAYAETIHALNHLKVLGHVKSTADNLKAGMEGEAYEFNTMYPGFLKEASADGNTAALKSFTYAMEAEKGHYDQYARALKAVEKGEDLPPKKTYVCEICGHTHEGDEAPDQCPICGANRKAYTEVQ